MPKNDPVLVALQRIDEKITRLQKAVSQEIKTEKKIEQEEQSEISELQKLEKLEKQLEDEVRVKPIYRITYRDFVKSAIGSFFGVLGHFSFFYGVKISEQISVSRASILYLIALLVGAGFLYMTGFRTVERRTIVKFIPIRLTVIYITSIITVLVVLYLFDFVTLQSSFVDIYKSVSTISILAVMGAATADLVGKESEK